MANSAQAGSGAGAPAKTTSTTPPPPAKGPADSGSGKPVIGNKTTEEKPSPAATPKKISSSELLTLTWVVLAILTANIIVGVLMIWGDREIWVWARVVFSLGVLSGLLIFASMLIYVIGRIRMEE